MTDAVGPGPEDVEPRTAPDPRPTSRAGGLRAAVRGARTFSHGWWAWTSDYAYVTWRQLRGVVAPGDAARYASGDRVPVLLLPGIYETWFFLDPLARVLHEAGHPVHTVPGLGHTLASLDDSSRLVAERLAELGLDRVVLVAHSKGGLIGKHLMSAAPVPTEIAGMVAVNTPFAGSRYATYFPARSVRALSPRFPAMRALALQRAAHSRIVSVYGLFDPHVPGGSELAGATNVRLPVMGHFRTVAHPAVQGAVLEHVEHLGRLAPGPQPRPGPVGDDAAT